MKNEYVPLQAVIDEVVMESVEIKTFTLRLKNKADKLTRYKPGQFLMLSVPGFGEAPFTFASSPNRSGQFQVSAKAVGSLTSALHGFKAGDIIGVRGPYGNYFPLEKMKHRDILFVAGGIGMAALRAAIHHVFKYRKNFGRVEVVYGCRTPKDMLYKDEVAAWQNNPRTKVHLTVDVPDQSWGGSCGVVCALFPKVKLSSRSAFVSLCGPAVMVKFAAADILKIGFKEENIYISLERYMRCGIGKCGHCYIGGEYVCTNGPVFSYPRLKELGAAEVS